MALPFKWYDVHQKGCQCRQLGVEGLRCGAIRCHNVPGGRSTEAAFWFEPDGPQVCMARRTARNSARQQEKGTTQAACVQGHRVVNRVFPIWCYRLALCLCLDHILPPLIAKMNLNTLKSTHVATLYINPPCFTLSWHQAFQWKYCQTCISKMAHLCYVFPIYWSTVQEMLCWGPYNVLFLILSPLYSPVLLVSSIESW